MRATSAKLARLTENTGKIKCWNVPHPEDGSQPKRNENKRMSNSDTQKTGMDIPATASPMIPRSMMPSRRTAASTPIGIPDQHGDGKPPQRQAEADGERLNKIRPDRPLSKVRDPKVAPQDAPGPVPVLHGKGVVQPVALPDNRQLLLGRLIASNDRRRIARRKVQREKYQQRQSEDGQHPFTQPAHEKGEHRMAPRPGP